MNRSSYGSSAAEAAEPAEDFEETLKKDNTTLFDKYRNYKLYNRKRILKPAKTKKGKWIRFYIFLAIAAALVIGAFFGFAIAPYDPLATDFKSILQPPSSAHMLGTDNTGRDVLSRILCGAINSFSLSFVMIAIIATVGTIIGLISGFFGGVLDTILMRFTDILLAFPNTVFAIAVVGMLGPGIFNTVIAMSLVWWTSFARVTRGLAASIRTKDFITEARFGGASTFKIIMRYVLPNILPRVIVMATMDIGHMILSLAGLSFLGLASQPPAPEWGYMLNEGRNYLQSAPWLLFFPGLAILITVIVFNLLGDSVRDILDPKDV